jgi:hypothetical protein
MKDYYDLWAIPRAIDIPADDLDAAIRATFERRRTPIPKERPPGLSVEMFGDEGKQRQWRAYAASLELDAVSLESCWFPCGTEPVGVRTKTWTTKEVVHVFLRR